MKLSTREDVALPADIVFAGVSDFEAFERRALRRGAEVSRNDPTAGPGLGTTWDARFSFRGRERTLSATVAAYDPPRGEVITSTSGGLDGRLTVDLVALNPNKTRMIVGLELRPTNLSARLLVQSLKLAKGSLSKRFETAVAEFAQSLERDNGGARARA